MDAPPTPELEYLTADEAIALRDSDVGKLGAEALQRIPAAPAPSRGTLTLLGGHPQEGIFTFLTSGYVRFDSDDGKLRPSFTVRY